MDKLYPFKIIDYINSCGIEVYAGNEGYENNIFFREVYKITLLPDSIEMQRFNAARLLGVYLWHKNLIDKNGFQKPNDIEINLEITRYAENLLVPDDILTEAWSFSKDINLMSQKFLVPEDLIKAKIYRITGFLQSGRLSYSR